MEQESQPIKLLVEELKPTKGDVFKKSIRVGYYHQHFDSYLPMDQTL